MKNLKKAILAVLVAVMVFGTCAWAAGNVQLAQVQVFNNGEDVMFYVRGIENNVDAAAATIGNVECDGLQYMAIKDTGLSICTYVMIDNSTSMPEKSRAGIKKLLTELIAARSENEKFAIATFGESLQQLIGYTNDYVQLKDCINNIQFNDQSTYLTDMVYEAIASGAVYNEAGDYVRILLVADGVDGDSVGYTEEELKTLLSGTRIPIYSLGVYNKKKSNNSQIEKMFALSRHTGVTGYVYDKLEDEKTFTELLAKDRDLYLFEILPKDESLDGSEKTVSLLLRVNGETMTIQADKVRMGVRVVESKETDPVESTEVVSTVESSEEFLDASQEETSEPEEETEDEDEESEEEEEEEFEFDFAEFWEEYQLWILIGAGVLLLIIIVIIILLVISSKKKKLDNEFKSISNVDLSNDVIGAPAADEQPERTVMNDYGVGGDRTMKTQSVWDGFSSANCIVTLKNVDVPMKQYQATLNDKLTVGRSAPCEIVIDGDPTISGKHCSISRRNSLYYLKDEGSRNGTFVNNVQIKADTQIKNGDVILVGNTRLEFTTNI